MSSQVTVDSLATLLSQSGEAEESAQAEDLYRRAVDAKESVLGKNHPSTLMSVHNLASLLVSYGEHMRPKNESQATLSRHRHHHNSRIAAAGAVMARRGDLYYNTRTRDHRV